MSNFFYTNNNWTCIDIKKNYKLRAESGSKVLRNT